MGSAHIWLALCLFILLKPCTSNWSGQETSTSERLYGISFVSRDEGWACGMGNTVLRTTDAGNTWTKMDTSQLWPYENWLAVDFLGDGRGWAAGSRGRMMVSNDHGQTWSYSFSGSEQMVQFHDIKIVDSNTVVAVGSNGRFIRTTNCGGNT
mmetsp:Transcript_20007/g.33602  ORF Transcript_20007/g.33602 Transcript_20007/m.33602 type:complete len:152 (-) Transcript_20007:2-457(-)